MSEKAKKTKETAEPEHFEGAMQELERLVSQMESGELPLAQMLGAYERGAQLLAYCKLQLQAVESQVKVLDQQVLKAFEQGIAGQGN